MRSVMFFFCSFCFSARPPRTLNGLTHSLTHSLSSREVVGRSRRSHTSTIGLSRVDVGVHISHLSSLSTSRLTAYAVTTCTGTSEPRASPRRSQSTATFHSDHRVTYILFKTHTHITHPITLSLSLSLFLKALQSTTVDHASSSTF